jgi:predicted ATP-grasp superfamily ATP-dependent carboligase
MSFNGRGIRPSDYIIQEYIPGKEEYATHLLCHHGTIRDHATFKHSHDSNFYVQGMFSHPRLTQRIETPAQVFAVIERIMSELRYSGFCCVDYKLDNLEKPRIFEVNPRLGASLGTDREALSSMIKTYCIDAAR